MDNTYDAGVAQGRRLEAADNEARMAEAASLLSSPAHHRVMQMTAGPDRHPCPAEFEDASLPGGRGCRLSAEEHHMLAYGILAENKELRRRVKALEHGEAEG